MFVRFARPLGLPATSAQQGVLDDDAPALSLRTRLSGTGDWGGIVEVGCALDSSKGGTQPHPHRDSRYELRRAPRQWRLTPSLTHNNVVAVPLYRTGFHGADRDLVMCAVIGRPSIVR